MTDIDDPFFPETRTGAATRRRWRRPVVIALIVVLVVAVGTMAAWRVRAADAQHARAAAAERVRAAARCPGLPDTAGPGFALSMRGGECVGWITEQDYPFGNDDPGTVAVITHIVAANRAVAASGKPYVRVGVLMPMTSTSTGAMSATDVRVSLEGAYAAQVRANSVNAPEFLDATPRIQLLLANEATDQSAWAPVVDAIGALRSGEHPVVAVTGLSISIPATSAAAERLGDLGIPTVGAVVTADDMVAKRMFKVSPSNKQYAEALRAALGQHLELGSAYLAYDRSDSDNYVQQLRRAFISTFDGTFDLDQHSGGFNGSKPPHKGTSDLFAGIVQDVCTLKPDVLFFSGRDRDLQPLVTALGGRGRCENPIRPLVVATGATGLTITPAEADAAHIGLLDASATDPTAWAHNVPGTPSYYPAFQHLFTASPGTGGLGFPDADLTDGYAVMHRDAVAVAIWATRRDAQAKEQTGPPTPNATPLPAVPLPDDVYAAMFGRPDDAAPSASGAIYFRELPANDLWPAGKPVPVIRIGSMLDSWPPIPLYVTPAP